MTRRKGPTNGKSEQGQVAQMSNKGKWSELLPSFTISQSIQCELHFGAAKLRSKLDKMIQQPSSLLSALRGLRISPLTPLQSLSVAKAAPLALVPQSHARTFTSTTPQWRDWLEPNKNRKKKKMKGRPRVATGGSVKGTTVIWGEWGLRMCDHHRRISAMQLKVAEATIKQRLRGNRYRLYTRVNCDIGVYVSGNEVCHVCAPDAGIITDTIAGAYG